MIVMLTTEQSWHYSWEAAWGVIGVLHLVDANYMWTAHSALLRDILMERFGIREDTVYVRRPNGELMMHSEGSLKRYNEMGDEAWAKWHDELLKPKFEYTSFALKELKP